MELGTSRMATVGVILAGGNGTRLRPLTYVANKHLLPVYDKPMIYYPIQTLKDMGCDEIVIVTGGEHIGGFANVLGDGSSLGVKFTYRVQPDAGGIAQALGCVEGLVDGIFPVILGDNFLGYAPIMLDSPQIFVKKVKDPERFGVFHKNKIVEKPKKHLSDFAVIGLYVYDTKVFDYIKKLKPSKRGELEITDVNNQYLKDGMGVTLYNGMWSDMGTFKSLLEVANYVSK